MDIDHTQQSSPRGTADELLGPSVTNAVLLWAAFPASFFLGFTPFVAVVFAYINRGKAPPVLRSHYSAVITTFWITLIIGFVGGILTFILIGWPILFVLAIWTVWRSVRGIFRVRAGEAMT